jgi:glycosyltransferase involved in cell wall biosynthesis
MVVQLMEAHRDESLFLHSIAVLIPAWQPDERLVALVESLVQFPFAAIVIVNDGSNPEHGDFFQRAGSLPKAIVLAHDRNRGTGRAIRTAMCYVLDKLPAVAGVVTADADGQHQVADIVRVAEALSRNGGRPVMGSRMLGEGVPLRSRFGNAVTHHVFRLLSGVNVCDTQCGLRGIPRQWLTEALKVNGDRYEFVLGLLAHFCRCGVPPSEVPIATIYIDENRSSHFKPVRDSVRIYSYLFRSYLSSFLIPCIDFAAFALVYELNQSLAPAVLAGRAAAVAAILLQRQIAHRSGSCAIPPIAASIVALVITGLLSLAGIWILTNRLHWTVFAAKLIAEIMLWTLFDLTGLRRRVSLRRTRVH